jgi:hypothetical protein
MLPKLQPELQDGDFLFPFQMQRRSFAFDSDGAAIGHDSHNGAGASYLDELQSVSVGA